MMLNYYTQTEEDRIIQLNFEGREENKLKIIKLYKKQWQLLYYIIDFIYLQ